MIDNEMVSIWILHPVLSCMHLPISMLDYVTTECSTTLNNSGSLRSANQVSIEGF